MKGISPLIATIILIALTVIIAGALGIWAANFVTSRIQEINQSSVETISIKCNVMKFSVISKNIINNNISFIILNDGPVDINGLSFVFLKLDEQNNIKDVNSVEKNNIIKRASYSRIEVPILINNSSKIEIRSIECPSVKVEVLP